MDVENVDAALQNIGFSADSSLLRGLDGSLTGGGTLFLDNQRGFQLDGDFRARARVQDGHLILGDANRVHFAPDAQVHVQLSQLDTIAERPVIRGEFGLEAQLQSGRLALPEGQILAFGPGSSLNLHADLGEDGHGNLAHLTGQLGARLQQQQLQLMMSRRVVDADVECGFARVDLGDIVVHEDGRYQILHPEIRVQMDGEFSTELEPPSQ